MRALIIDGQGQHDWKATTPILKKHLEDTALFAVDGATSPPQGADMSGFSPKFADYKVIVSNYDGDEWSDATKKAFVDYMLAGGGLVVVHAAGNSFSRWPEWNQMIGLSGARIPEEGPPHAYLIDLLDESHPITIGLPKQWLHAPDELSFR
ncbi:MAG TPA: ThuA domain-containing protein, partial [Pirellulales bacterium]|nr:ThuA domain-containing protein [Pirellulales bacterium]